MAGMSSGGGDEFDVPLNLVALIDILTNILFFLLMGMAVDEIQFEAGKIRLPYSTTEAALEVAVSVSISADELLVEQTPLLKIVNGKFKAKREGDKIVPLYDKLNTLRGIRQEKSQGLGKDDDVLFLVSDREVPFSILSPVMKTAAMAGYPKFRFAVVKR